MECIFNSNSAHGQYLLIFESKSCKISSLHITAVTTAIAKLPTITALLQLASIAYDHHQETLETKGQKWVAQSV
jgi:hypothetical protein